jgi:hypothetical protein
MGRRYRRNTAVEAAPLNDEAILLEPEGSNFFLLNRTSSLLWERMSEAVTAEALAREVCEAFADISASDALRDVNNVLEEMVALKLVYVDDIG